MRFSPLIKVAVVTMLIAPTVGAFGQGIGEVLSGVGAHPAVIVPRDLPDSFKAVKITVSNNGDPAASLTPYMLLGMQSSSANSGPRPEFLRLLDESWTDGSNYMLYGQSYLITYRLDMTLMDYMRLNSPRPGTTEGMPATQMGPMHMKMVLIRTDSIQSISPDPDLSKEAMLKILGPDGSATTPEQDMERKRTATVSSLKQISLGMIMYTADWDDEIPWVQSTAAAKYVTMPYIKNDTLWQTQNPNGGEFRFNMALAGVSSTAIEAPAEEVLYYESKEWPDGKRCVAYADGHVRIVDRSQWAALQASLSRKHPRTGKKPLPLNYGMGPTIK